MRGSRHPAGLAPESEGTIFLVNIDNLRARYFTANGCFPFASTLQANAPSADRAGGGTGPDATRLAPAARREPLQLEGDREGRVSGECRRLLASGPADSRGPLWRSRHRSNNH